MINPTATDILRLVDATLKDKVEPSLSDLTGRSALATVRHMLRHVLVRVDVEGQLLTDDIAALRPLLQQVSRYLASKGVALAKEIDATLAKAHRAPGAYPTLDSLGLEAGALRECVYQALKQLQSLRDAHGTESDYVAVRAAIRSYLVRQIEEEEKTIGPAFYGQGPRR